MSSSIKALSLLEQKRLQWAKEREEMVGLCGLWGHPKYRTNQNDNKKLEAFEFRKNVLPPIPTRSETEEKGHQNCRPEEESETSGYLSDSPKHVNEKETMSDNRYTDEMQNSVWYVKEEKRDIYSTDENNEGSRSYVADRKSYKNYKNQKWAQHNDSWHVRNAKNMWFGTPDSVSSDDCSRLRWGDRGVGIGHLWEPVIHQPDSRLPQLESYRPTPRWVERGLRKSDDSQKADILIIHHPEDEQYKNYSSDSQTPKNFLLGQNVRLTPDVIEERERKRRRALEHQNAIRQQLEDRDRRRKEERLNKLREERLEEERIKREQETERLRLEEEQRRTKEKEEKERRKEQVMKEAIEVAERKAKEEKLHQRKHVHMEEVEVVQAKKEKPSESGREKKSVRTPKSKSQEDVECKIRTSRSEKIRPTEQLGKIKTRKDSSSQFDPPMRIPNGVQLLNMNNMPMDGSLALVLDTPPADNNFLLPSDGVQLALLMSPGNVGPSQIIPFQTPIPTAMTPRGRVLTPSKFRVLDNQQISQRSKTTQTDGICCSASLKSSSRIVARYRKQNRRSERASGGSDSSKSNSLERFHAPYHCTTSTKYRSRSQPKYSIDDRPKWGINRPSVQYKKQSEKDLYYQKRIRQRLKKVNDMSTSTEPSPKGNDNSLGEEKLLESEMRLLKCDTDEDEEEPKDIRSSAVLRNGYRMNSNPSSPLFVPIDSDRTTAEKSGEQQEFVLELTIEPEAVKNDDENKTKEEEDFEDTAVPGSVGFVTKAQLEAIRQIASLREIFHKFYDYDELDDVVLVMAFKLDDFLSKKKEPTQVLDLSKVKITSKEEFKKYFDKVPEFKIKPEKVVLESIKIKDKDFSFVPGKREEKQMKEWSFPDPTPPDMRAVKLEDLCPVNIDWKMLTTLRPKTKVEEEMFSRLVQLGKLDLKYKQNLLREKATDWVRKTKNPRSSIVEVRVLSCKECGEDFCDEPGTSPKKKKKKNKRKSRKRKRSKVRRVKTRKNSIFNRPPTRGCSRDHGRRGSHAKVEMRSSSLNRIQSSQKPAFLKLNRSKSAPRLRFKRETSDPMFAPLCEYASDSAPTQTDYSSQSDSESYQNRDSSPESSKEKHSVRVGFVDGYQSDDDTYASRKRKKIRHRSDNDASGFDSHGSNESLVDSSGRSKSPGKPTSRPCSKYPTTIQIKFDGFHSTSSVFHPRKSYAPSKFVYGRRNDPLTALKNQEVTKIMEGFAKIDLSFVDEDAAGMSGKPFSEYAVTSPKRVSSRFSWPRTRCEREPIPSTSFIRGKGLLGKSKK